MINKPEYILCSAIWYKDLPLKQVFDSNVNPVNVDKGIVFCGFRHCHAMYSMCSITGLRSVPTEVGDFEQGFLTSKNRFVNRVVAAQIAIDCGQVNKEDVRNQILFSEDLW